MTDVSHPVADLRQLIAGAAKDGATTYSRNEAVFRQGEPAGAVFYVEQGKVKVTVLSQAGKEAILAIAEPGDFIGEGCLTGQLRRTTAVAMTDCSLVRIGKTSLVSLLRNDARFSELFSRHLVKRNMRMEDDLADHLFSSSEQRLARLLSRLAKLDQDEKPEAVIAKISQEELAEMVGTTRARISSFMNKFRRLGFVDYDYCGHLKVRQSLRSVFLAE
jgi:CRP/FNR family transcriptional regulator, cyclic AMP receptor protein